VIFVARSRVSEPASLSSKRAADARADASKYYKRTPDLRRQERFSFDPKLYRAEDVVQALTKLFSGKCAYCESPLTAVTAVDVDHFRPMSGALGLDGSLEEDHYWWLAYEWANLYASCPECNRSKGQRFPVGASRAKLRATGRALVEEQPLLLDPCAEDDHPGRELVFTEDGIVSSETERGRVTIEVLGLNRPALVSARQAEALAARFAADDFQLSLQNGNTTSAAGDVELAFDGTKPYSALRRQVFQSRIRHLSSELEKLVAGDPSLRRLSREGWVSSARKEAIRRNWVTDRRARETYSVTDEAVAEDYYGTTRTIERVEIRNFRIIRNLSISFPSTVEPGQTPWLMLLGENGTGKTSVLQAVALALMGKAHRDRLEIDPSRIVRHGASSGSVRVYLSGTLQPITLKFRRHDPQFESSDPEPKVLILGYGATRLLPRPGMAQPTSTEFVRAENLFNPFVPLADLDSWLHTLSDAQFDAVARALKGLLPLGKGDRLVREDGRVEVRLSGARVSLDELSDGYQSVVALAADIMEVMLSRWPAMEVAEGIVAIDELGSHLHPRWQMRIVGSLRELFPRIQFLASTHDPLCLRGLFDGEVLVLRRYAGRGVVVISDLPPVQGLRVDQLLTSEHFGLNSTTDPEVEELFEEYYRLLARRSLTPGQEERLADLRSRLDELKLLGRDQREQLMLEAIDEYLAESRSVTDAALRRGLRDETVHKVAEIWREAAKRRPGA
jgi:uncharacterized protein (TIGR02646 family)